MSVEKAKEYYTGKPGGKKLNCAQAILAAFQDTFDLPHDIIDRFKTSGGGRSPEGQCGALYAAKYILEKTHPEKIGDCENALLRHAGSTKCREIRALNRLSCAGCVEKVAEYLEKI